MKMPVKTAGQLARYVTEGGQTIGYCGSPFPVELADALGLLAVPLLGLGAARDDAIEQQWIDDNEDPDVRTICVRALRGDLAGLRAIVSTRTTDHAHYYLREILRLGQWENPVPLHLYDLMPLRGEGIKNYNRKEIRRLAAFFQRISGCRLTDEAIAAAVAKENTARSERRKADEARLAAARAGRRLMIITSAPLYDDRLANMAAEQGLDVVAIDDGSARLVAAPDLVLCGDPLDAIADFYQGLPSALAHPRADRTAWLDSRVQAGAVDAVLFWMHMGDLRLGWDFPVLRDQLGQQGIAAHMVRADIDSAEGEAAIAAAIGELAARL